MRSLAPSDLDWMLSLLGRTCGRHRSSRSEYIDVAPLPGLVATSLGQPVGLCLVRTCTESLEIAALTAEPEVELDRCWQVLCDAVVAQANAGTRRIFTVLTNTEQAAAASAQRAGLRLVAARPGALEIARRVRPDVTTQQTVNGLLVRDELEFERLL